MLNNYIYIGLVSYISVVTDVRLVIEHKHISMLNITKTNLFKYTEKLSSKICKFSDKYIDLFYIFLLKT